MTAAPPLISAELAFPSVWIERKRLIPDIRTKKVGPWSFDICPWTRDFADDFNPYVVVFKGAQLAWTEVALSCAEYTNVVDHASVLYCLPDDSVAGVFSASRIDPSIRLSPEIAKKYTDVSNVRHKQAGVANLWIRGMNSRAKLKTIDPRVVYIDELDEMPPWAVTMAEKRVSGQLNPRIIKLSTPTLPEFGIDIEFEASDQKHWLVPCYLCKKAVFLDWGCIWWDERLTRKEERYKSSRIKCPQCGGIWQEDARQVCVRKGSWVAKNPESKISGYRITQACSLVVTPEQLVRDYHRVRWDPVRLTEHMNAVGHTYVAKGMRLTAAHITQCIRNYRQADGGQRCTMGVDVGSELHYRISCRVPDARDPDGRKVQVLKVGVVHHFEELDVLMRAFGIGVCVVDGNPERRECHRFQKRWGGPLAGRVWLAFYNSDLKTLVSWQKEKGWVSINRTEALDAMTARFRYPADEETGEAAGTIDLPVDLPEGFIDQMCAPVRTEQTNPQGEPRTVYVANSADHYAHASLYDEIAGLKTGAVASGAVPPKSAAGPDKSGGRGFQLTYPGFNRRALFRST